MSTENLTSKALKEIFGDRETTFDLAEGVVRLPNNERQIFISSENIWGLYKSLALETGDAWQVVMKNCGYTWGKRFMESLSRDVSKKLNVEAGELNVTEFVDLIETYFSFHGWGRLTIDLSEAESSGIIQCHLQNSLVTHSLTEVGGTVDYLISGMLKAVFEFVADRELDCLQISCARRGTGNQCEFLISAPARIESLEPLAGKISVNDAVSELKAA